MATADAVAAALEVSLAAPAMAPARDPVREPPAAADGDPDARTRREREVLDLLCRRQTDAEIAAALSVSRRTVQAHVSHILAKLGAPNRRAAVALAARRGLIRPPDQPANGVPPTDAFLPGGAHLGAPHIADGAQGAGGSGGQP
jgi:DNA-binding CsgD family transcriptional regulator